MSEGSEVVSITVPLNVTMTSKGNDVMIVVQSKVLGMDGREWHTSVAGKGRDIDSAVSDLHAEIARKPMQIAGIVSRALKTGKSDGVEVGSQKEVKVSEEAQAEIDENKSIKQLIKENNLKIKFPFGSTTATRRKMILEAIAEKSGSTAKKEKF